MKLEESELTLRNGATVEQEAAVIRRMQEHDRSFMLSAFAGDRIVGNASLHASEAPLGRQPG